MPSYASLTDPKSYHLLTYGTLLGSNLFQTFIAGPLGFKALPRAQFGTLQTAVLPTYFSVQTVLPLALAFTWPGEKVARVGGAVIRENTGWQGMTAGSNVWHTLVPNAIMFWTSLLNLVVLGPATTRVMKKRKHQGERGCVRPLVELHMLITVAETRDGKRYYDPGPKSAEMQRLTSSFMMLHGASSLASLVGTIAMIYYGFELADRL